MIIVKIGQNKIKKSKSHKRKVRFGSSKKRNTSRFLHSINYLLIANIDVFADQDALVAEEPKRGFESKMTIFMRNSSSVRR